MKTVKILSTFCICDRPQENWPSSHPVMIVEIPVLKTAFARVSVDCRTGLIDLLNVADLFNLIY